MNDEYRIRMKKIFKKIVVLLLTLEARAVLWRFRPTIVVVTGSVGKTATKDAIAAVLTGVVSVRKSPKSFNSEFGVPLTILGIDESGWGSAVRWARILLRGAAAIFGAKRQYPSFLVLEVGADHPGDIRRIARWVRPDCVVVTQFAETPVHLAFFPSREALLAEKALLVQALKKDGLLVVNADDSDVRSLAKDTTARTITIGREKGADYSAPYAAIAYKGGDRFPEGIQAKIEYQGKMIPLFLRGTLGLHYVLSALAAVVVGSVYGVNILDAATRLGTLSFPAGRMKILHGISGSIIIDDSYNASPVALRAAFAALKELVVSGRKIALLGDMRELGEKSESEHIKAGKLAAETIDYLFTVGTEAEKIGEGARMGMDESHLRHFTTVEEAGAFLKGFLKDGDALLVKGSQSMRLERAVAAVLLHPERRKDLLVRQDSTWDDR